MQDEALREACFVAQDIALAIVSGLAVERLSVRELATRSGVNREQVQNLIDGKSWPAIYTVTRLFRVLEREIKIPQPPSPRDS